MVAKAIPRLKPSTVTKPGSGQEALSTDRTSTGMFFSRREDDVITRVEERIGRWSMLPPRNAEGIQVLHYEVSERVAEVWSVRV